MGDQPRLRITTALLIAAGVHTHVIQQRMRHSSITTKLDVYGHVLPATDATVTAYLDGLYRDATV